MTRLSGSLHPSQKDEGLFYSVASDKRNRDLLQKQQRHILRHKESALFFSHKAQRNIQQEHKSTRRLEDQCACFSWRVLWSVWSEYVTGALLESVYLEFQPQSVCVGDKLYMDE